MTFGAWTESQIRSSIGAAKAHTDINNFQAADAALARAWEEIQPLHATKAAVASALTAEWQLAKLGLEKKRATNTQVQPQQWTLSQMIPFFKGPAGQPVRNVIEENAPAGIANIAKEVLADLKKYSTIFLVLGGMLALGYATSGAAKFLTAVKTIKGKK